MSINGIKRLGLIWLFSGMYLSLAHGECRDRAAIGASDEFAKSLFREADIFHPGKVLKHHHPEARKEIASYVQTGDKKYSIFTLVDAECQAVFRKRTRIRNKK